MASNINASVPSGPVAYTADMRNNFAIAGAEITELQAATASVVTSVAGLTGDVTQAQLWAALVAGLPTTLPATSGVIWLNGQVLCVS